MTFLDGDFRNDAVTRWLGRSLLVLAAVGAVVHAGHHLGFWRL